MKPGHTVSRQRAWLADSVLRLRGVDPSSWRRLTNTSLDTLGRWRRFLRAQKTPGLAPRLAGSYAVPAWWIVRYVRTEAPVAERAEEWRVRVYPDGRPLDVRHVVTEHAAGPSLAPDSVRRLARGSLAAARLDITAFVETRYEEVERPRRRDVTVIYEDTAVTLPGGATARA